MSDPVIIGGTGGSGTRLLCQLAMAAGIFMGDDLNYAQDSLPLNGFSSNLLHGRGGLEESLAKSLAGHFKSTEQDGAPWGWKLPGTYLYPWYLHEIYPDMKFIHVIRDGRDMAYAPNISYVVYGPVVGVEKKPEVIMALWALTNMQCAVYGEEVLKHYYRIRFEDILREPVRYIKEVYEFLGVDTEPADTQWVVDPGKPSVGRWQEVDDPDKDRVIKVGQKALKRFGYL